MEDEMQLCEQAVECCGAFAVWGILEYNVKVLEARRYNSAATACAFKHFYARVVEGVRQVEHRTVSTKLLLPRPRRGYIPRERLFHRLGAVMENRLTVIQGGPGSGKTTLLAAYIEQEALPARWISLDSELDHAALFWEYMIQALEGLLGTMAGEFAAFLRANAGRKTEEVVKALINALDQSRETLLVLDDLHLLRDEALLESLAYFLDNMPPCLHVVVLTRERPALYLAGYELRGELLYLDEQDLLLTEGEAALFLQQTLGLDLPEKRLLDLVAQAGGWVGGLQLLAAAERAGTAPVARALGRDLLDEYMTAEIVDHLPPDEQEFLLLTAVPSYWSREVAAQLLPGVPFDEMVERLLGHALLLQCIDEARGLFKYHSLLREALLRRFKRQEKKAEVRRQLARIFESLGDEEESLRHLFALEDYDAAMRRILQLPPGAAHYTLMHKVPVEAALQSFDFAFQKFFYHYFNFEFDTCTALYTKAMTLAENDERFKAFAGASAFVETQQMYSESSIPVLEKILASERLPEKTALYPLTQALVHTKNAAFLYYHDHFPEALQAIEKSAAQERRVPGSYIRYYDLTLETQICEEMGLLNRAIAAQGQTQRLIENNRLLRDLHAPTFALTVAGLYMKQLRLGAAAEALQSCEAAVAERGGQLRHSYDYNLAELLFLQGETARAAQLLDKLIATETYANILTLAPLLKHLYRAGSMTPALQEVYLQSYKQMAGNHPLNARLLYARLQAARGGAAAAAEVLDEVLQLARKRGSQLKIVEATLQKLSLLLEKSTGDARRLGDLYREAVYYACENSILLPFHMEAGAIKAMHRRYGAELAKAFSKNEKCFHARVLQVCGVEKEALLSEREREILQAIAGGLTNNEIGERLFISLPTVKTHIASIFRKLGVKSRVAAVEKGRRLEMIEG